MFLNTGVLTDAEADSIDRAAETACRTYSARLVLLAIACDNSGSISSKLSTHIINHNLLRPVAADNFARPIAG